MDFHVFSQIFDVYMYTCIYAYMGSIDFRSVFNRFTIDEGEDDGDDGDDAIGFPACPTHVQGVPKMTIINQVPYAFPGVPCAPPTPSNKIDFWGARCPQSKSRQTVGGDLPADESFACRQPTPSRQDRHNRPQHAQAYLKRF